MQFVIQKEQLFYLNFNVNLSWCYADDGINIPYNYVL